MRTELVAEVKATAPRFYGNVYISCGDGWAGLLKELGAYVAERGECGDGAVALQVKEKFGGLRVYVGTAPTCVYNKIKEIERRSTETCEECGEPGELRPGGWTKTLCGECYSGE